MYVFYRICELYGNILSNRRPIRVYIDKKLTLSILHMVVKLVSRVVRVYESRKQKRMESRIKLFL